MKAGIRDVLPARTRRSLQKLGADISVARRRRALTVAMMAERMGVAKSTYSRIEKGDPTVSVGAYAMALFALGLGEVLGEVLDASRDEQGLALAEESLPKRVRVKRTPRSS